MNNKFVLCRSDTGDGGWSLHAPGSTDEQIAEGDAPYLVSGPAEWVEGGWNRPDAADYLEAAEALRTRWRVKDYADGWIEYDTEEEARASKEAQNGALVERV